jgi:hypothetical protein
MSYAGNISFERSTTVPAIEEYVMAGKVWRIGNCLYHIQNTKKCSYTISD